MLFNIIEFKKGELFFKEMGQNSKDFMIKNTNILHASFKALNFAFCFKWGQFEKFKRFHGK